MKEQLKALVIDDSKNAREILIQLLTTYCPEVKVVGDGENIEMAFTAVKFLKPDIIFLDIEMPGGSGFDLLNRLKMHDILVVFTTAYEEYAVQAIKKGALGYLLKPLSIDDLIEVVGRAVKGKKSMGKENDTLLIADSNGYELLNTKEIVYCLSKKSYTLIFTENEGEKLISKGLREIQDALPSQHFYRVHNSYLVNRKFIKRYNIKDGHSVITTTNSVIPVARRKKNEFKEWLEQTI